MKLRHTLAVAILACGAVGTAMFLQQEEPQAADHSDSPATMADSTVDIGDLYAWHKGTGADQKLVTVLTFDGVKPPAADQKGSYNPDALYTIHIDNTGDTVADVSIYVRFAKNRNDEWGMQVLNLPGSTGPITGAVETELTDGEAKAWVGLRDDPFFFDLTGYIQTVQSGALAFDPTRDALAGTNITAIVLEMPMSAALSAGTKLKVWATTGTK